MVNVTGRPLLSAQGGRQSGLNPGDLDVPCEVRLCENLESLGQSAESSHKCRVSAFMSHRAAGLFKLDQVPLQPIFAV
jgi:hypothetical protein